MQVTIPVRMGPDLIEALDKHLTSDLSRKTRSQLIRDILSEWVVSKGKRK